MKSEMDSINNYLMHNFANLAEEVENRLDYLNNLRVSVEAMLLKCPEGKLKVSPGGTEETFRYYFYKVSQTEDMVYLDKSNNRLKSRLAQKKYYEKLIRNLDIEIAQLNKIQKMNIKDSVCETYKLLSPGIKKLVEPIDVDAESLCKQWRNIEYEKKSFDPRDQSAFYSNLEERMRSKSEVLIANTLALRGIPYKYECPVYRANGVSLHPDFTILDVKNRKIKYWEHLGKMDDMSYVTSNIWKLEEYKKIGINLGDNLFVTYETMSHPLTTAEINHNIDLILGKGI